MQAWLSVEGSPDGDELTSLYRWLSQDPDVRRDAKVTAVPAPARPGDMGGGALELVNVVLSNSIALSGLVVAVASWIGSRRKSRPIRIEYEGVTITLDADTPEAIEAALRALGAGRPGDAE